MNNNINDFDNLSCSARQDIMNTRTYVRNIPSQPLQPYLNARPVLTKYSIMPIVDPRSEIKTPLIQQATYSPREIFNPGAVTAKAPWSGFATNINHESELRGQIFALQECSQAKYVPGSKSSLYNVQWKNQNSDSVKQPFPSLFKKEYLGPTDLNADPNVMGGSIFNNSTRQQLKNQTKPTTC
jgi:hypothetical protein